MDQSYLGAKYVSMHIFSRKTRRHALKSVGKHSPFMFDCREPRGANFGHESDLVVRLLGNNP